MSDHTDASSNGTRLLLLTDVLNDEWEEIRERRRQHRNDEADAAGTPDHHPEDTWKEEGEDLRTEPTADRKSPPGNLVGLALSGGGIRSATFCLGLLQGLRNAGLLHTFDYLSTVSGGGYVGGWWSAWLSRDQRGEIPSGTDRRLFPRPEAIEPQREPSYVFAGRRTMKERVADGALSAGVDPIHHLRLFSNYLTPKKGALSGDTWRAIAVVSRNLLLTWAILIPIFLAVMLVGQLYFLLHPVSAGTFLRIEHLTGDTVQERIAAILWIVLPMLGWIVVVVTAWMFAVYDGDSRMQRLVQWIELAALAGLVVSLILAFNPKTTLSQTVTGQGVLLSRQVPTAHETITWWWTNWYAGILWALVAVGFVVYGYRTGIRNGDGSQSISWRSEVRRNRLVRVNSTLLIVLTLILAVTLVAGFGHELVDYLISESGPIARAGGWSGLLVTIGSGIFTAMKASPSGGEDRRKSGATSMTTRVIFAAAPPLVMLACTILASWVAHSLLVYIASSGVELQTAIAHEYIGTSIGVTLAFVFAWYELKCAPLTQERSSFPKRLLFLLGILGFLTLEMISGDEILSNFHPGTIDGVHRVDAGVSHLLFVIPRGVTALFAFITIGLLAARRSVRHVMPTAGGQRTFRYRRRRGMTVRPDEPHAHRTVRLGDLLLRSALVAVLLAAAATVTVFVLIPGVTVANFLGWLVSGSTQSTCIYVVPGFLLAIAYVLVEMIWGIGSNDRMLALITAIAIVLAIVLAIGFYHEWLVISGRIVPGVDGLPLRGLLGIYAAFGLITTFISCAIALGWTIDPNMLSIHAFYKARLTRAYLGASNDERHKVEKEITEAVKGDDLTLANLRNCERGGPYHLINATLNLVGGSDLATAQRSAASFLLSHRYCGSGRTGYRPTGDYMDGKFTLGTAVSVSGAAASPNMGSKTPTAALAMLMTMFNVRLGYWAPTPNKEDWQSPQARLWPFYTIRELLSQTNALASYCYLTDGGHFENTGLYTLIERGCRFIVLADCGADPDRSFDDLGQAVRRCRIDFGTEFDLDVIPFMVTEENEGSDGNGMQHFVVGTFTHAESHLRGLGWTPEEIEANRTGAIIVVKPTLTGDETVDVRQYGFTNAAFPQQSTADQWFDESQFESYRRLGQLSVERLFGTIGRGMERLEEGAAGGRPIPQEVADMRDMTDDACRRVTIRLDKVPRFFESASVLIRAGGAAGEA